MNCMITSAAQPQPPQPIPASGESASVVSYLPLAARWGRHGGNPREQRIDRHQSRPKFHEQSGGKLFLYNCLLRFRHRDFAQIPIRNIRRKRNLRQAYMRTIVTSLMT